LFQIEKEYALPDRQCTSFHAAGCHFTGPVALRLRLSSDLPIILFPLSLCKKTQFYYTSASHGAQEKYDRIPA